MMMIYDDGKMMIYKDDDIYGKRTNLTNVKLLCVYYFL